MGPGVDFPMLLEWLGLTVGTAVAGWRLVVLLERLGDRGTRR